MHLPRERRRGMGRRKKETVELRFYEIPQGEPVLALLGEEWNRVYGHDSPYMHFHNLMEIGVCRNGEGVVVLDEKDYFYQNGTIIIIPQNISHTTISNGMQKNAWEYLYLNPDPVIAKLYDGQLAKSNEALQLLRSSPLFLDAASYPFLMAEIDAAMNEMRTQGMHYRQMVNACLQAILIEVLRMQAKGQEHRLETSTSNNMRQISDALSYVENYYAEAMKVKDLSVACGMSETYFRRIFEEYTHMTPMDYVNLVRVQKACEYMLQTEETMDQIARKVGFTTVSTFNRNFKKFLDISPYQWKIKPDNYERKLQNYHITALKGW